MVDRTPKNGLPPGAALLRYELSAGTKKDFEELKAAAPEDAEIVAQAARARRGGELVIFEPRTGSGWPLGPVDLSARKADARGQQTRAPRMGWEIGGTIEVDESA